jgi:hypothetical protein
VLLAMAVGNVSPAAAGYDAVTRTFGNELHAVTYCLKAMAVAQEEASNRCVAPPVSVQSRAGQGGLPPPGLRVGVQAGSRGRLGDCCTGRGPAPLPPPPLPLPRRMLAYGSKFLHPSAQSAEDDILACFCHVASTSMYLNHDNMAQVGGRGGEGGGGERQRGSRPWWTLQWAPPWHGCSGLPRAC